MKKGNKTNSIPIKNIKLSSILIIVIILLIGAIIYLQLTNEKPNLAPNIDSINQYTSKLNDIPKTPEEIKQTSTDYLKQEWAKFLNKSTFLREANQFLIALNPVFKIALNQNYEISTNFFQTIVIWWFICTILYILIKTLFRYYFPEDAQLPKYIYLISALALTAIIAQSGLIQEINKIIGFAKKLLPFDSLLTDIAYLIVIGLVLTGLARAIEIECKNILKIKKASDEEKMKKDLKRMKKELSEEKEKTDNLIEGLDGDGI